LIDHPDQKKKKEKQRCLRAKLHLDEMDLTDIYQTFHPAAAEYIFFSAAHGTFYK
jgi:hypothetical protein